MNGNTYRLIVDIVNVSILCIFSNTFQE